MAKWFKKFQALRRFIEAPQPDEVRYASIRCRAFSSGVIRGIREYTRERQRQEGLFRSQEPGVGSLETESRMRLFTDGQRPGLQYNIRTFPAMRVFRA